jgi:hypothetical protein
MLNIQHDESRLGRVTVTFEDGALSFIAASALSDAD